MKNFNKIYERIYKESNELMEMLRKKNRNKTTLIVIAFVIIEIIVIKFFKSNKSNEIVNMFSSISPIIILLPILGVVFALERSKNMNNYNLLFKNKVIKKFVKEYSEDLEYNPTSGISSIDYRRANFESYDKYYSEDLIFGLLESKYSIKMAEVKTEKESRDSKGRKTTYTVFEGLFAEIYLDKNINVSMSIRKNGISLFDGDSKLEMDSGEFEKIFNVYSTNKIIAMQLLTSDVMEYFIDFKNINKITPEIKLDDNKLYIRFPTGNVFEAKVAKSALDYSILKKYFDIINFTLTLTEKFLKNISETEID